MRHVYIGVIERGEKGYGVFFPDVPGCVSAGDSVAEAIAMGTEALTLHLEGLLAEDMPLPEAREVAVDDIDPEVRIACLAAFPVTLPTRSKRVNVMLDETLLGLIDARTGNRSAFLAEAAREKLERERA